MELMELLVTTGMGAAFWQFTGEGERKKKNPTHPASGRGVYLYPIYFIVCSLCKITTSPNTLGEFYGERSSLFKGARINGRIFFFLGRTPQTGGEGVYIFYILAFILGMLN
jgi:hypothetical protein